MCPELAKLLLEEYLYESCRECSRVLRNASAEKFVDLEVQNRDLKRVPDSFPEF